MLDEIIVTFPFMHMTVYFSTFPHSELTLASMSSNSKLIVEPYGSMSHLMDSSILARLDNTIMHDVVNNRTIILDRR